MWIINKTKMSKSIAKSCAISDIRKEYFEINKCGWNNTYFSTLNAFATDEEYKRMNKEIIRIDLAQQVDRGCTVQIYSIKSHGTYAGNSSRHGDEMKP